MEHNNERRSFLKYLSKYLVSIFAFVVALIFSPKINKNEGFKIGKMNASLGPAEASGECGMGLNCSGGGGQCGMGLNCGGGGGQCGMGLNCSGGGGQCGMGLNCAGE